MGRLRHLTLPLLLLALGLTGCAGSLPPLATYSKAPTTPLLFQGVRVFDGERELPGPHDVLVRQGAIAYVGPAGTLPPPKAALRIPGEGRTLLPGLWDSHVHLGGGNGEAPWDSRLPDVERQLESLVFAGVTSAVDAGRSTDTGKLGRRIRRGRLVGPNLIRFSRVFTKTGGHPIPLIRALLPWPIAGIGLRRSVREIDSVEEVAKAIAKEIKDSDPDLVKIMYNAIPPGTPHLSKAELQALIDAAHAADRRVGVHVGTPKEAREAVASGADLLMHTPWTSELSDEDLAALAMLAKMDRPVLTTRRIYLTIVQGLEGRWVFSDLERAVADPDRLARLGPKPEGWGEEIFDAAYLKKLPRWDRILGENIKRLHAAGIPLLVGTDCGVPGLFHGASLHRELEALVALGFTPLEVLQRTTSRPAAYFQPKGGRGRIEKGAIADLLLVEGNPLQWITDTQRVVDVWQGGEAIERHPADAIPK